MEFEVGYILSIVVIGLSFLGFILGMMIDEINRKKGAIATILSLILLLLGGYSYWMVGQWQKQGGGPSVNALNKCLFIYREIPPASPTILPLVPPGTSQD